MILPIVVAIIFGGAFASLLLFYTEQGKDLKERLLAVIGRSSGGQDEEQDENSISTPFNVVHKVLHARRAVTRLFSNFPNFKLCFTGPR